MTEPHADAERDMLLILADISGYTRFMMASREGAVHGQGLISELLRAVIRQVDVPLEISKLEGDAIFLFADSRDQPDWEGTCALVGERLFQLIEAFDARLRELVAANMCTCPACKNAGLLRLKVIAHAGRALRYRLGRFEELAGVDVILVHRLLKNAVAPRSYVLLTDAAHGRLRSGASWQAMEEDCKDVGKVKVWVSVPEGHQEPLPKAGFLVRLGAELTKVLWNLRYRGLSRERLEALPDR